MLPFAERIDLQPPSTGRAWSVTFCINGDTVKHKYYTRFLCIRQPAESWGHPDTARYSHRIRIVLVGCPGPKTGRRRSSRWPDTLDETRNQTTGRHRRVANVLTGQVETGFAVSSLDERRERRLDSQHQISKSSETTSENWSHGPVSSPRTQLSLNYTVLPFFML